jgi:hypothetical protein
MLYRNGGRGASVAKTLKTIRVIPPASKKPRIAPRLFEAFAFRAAGVPQPVRNQ